MWCFWLPPRTSFLSRSTVKTSQTIQWQDGKTYPLVRLDISSASHPFFTGKMKLVDSTGQIERFRKRFGDAKKPGEKKRRNCAGHASSLT
jgi:large subunit ribosomal protein L31